LFEVINKQIKTNSSGFKLYCDHSSFGETMNKFP